MAGFTIDITGRIKNFDITRNQPLVPLYEAIVNSIHAIEERRAHDGRSFNPYVTIEIVRDQQLIIKGQGIDYSINDVIGFNVIDNGVGLDENNMRSFLQSDSTYKASIGGKGVGRFSWLKAFKKADVESIFLDTDSTPVRRQFEFSLEKQEIDDTLTECDNYTDNRTEIKLIDYKYEYRKNVNKHADTIATKIMQHCVIYLMAPDCPKITVVDVADGNTISINDLFHRNIKKSDNISTFTVQGTDYELLNIEMEDPAIGGSKLYLCANSRVVREIPLEKQVVDLDKNLFRDQGFYYIGVVSGKTLDESVSTSRTSFDLPEESGDGELSVQDIVAAASEKIEEFLSDYLVEVRAQKDERIRRYISNEAPQYRHLLKYMPDRIREIKPSLSDAKLDEELYRLRREFELQLRTDNQNLMEKMRNEMIVSDVYQEEFRKQVERISDANKSVLAEYVAHRKIILELLKQGVRRNDDGKYNRESFIHNLIYPMRRTADEVGYEAHNLWLIDERLSYCDYISSDVPFSNDPKEERPDIMMLDHPVAVSDEENTGRAYESIVIFELKKPQRDDYTASDNPIQQMLGYVDKLKTNRVKDKDGRIINVDTNTQFYLYAVCDITPNLIKVADDRDFVKTPDGRGYYRYHDKKKAYIEILSYDKVIQDAMKRNKILFDKLGLV